MPTECPVCLNVNPTGVSECLRCNVKLEFVGIAAEPATTPAVAQVVDDAVPVTKIACPHCGFAGNSDVAIRCSWCKKRLSTAPPLDERLLSFESEPSSTAKVCGSVVVALGGIHAVLLFFLLIGLPHGLSFRAPRLPTILGIGIALLIQLAGLGVLQGTSKTKTGFYVALAVLAFFPGLGFVGSMSSGITNLTVILGGFLTLLTATAIAFTVDHVRVRNRKLGIARPEDLK